jgi:hypothetical protein
MESTTLHGGQGVKRCREFGIDSDINSCGVAPVI